MTSFFEPALDQMRRTGSLCYGPESFQDYLDRHGLRNHSTCQHISVDSLNRLQPELRDCHTMVFRLGAPDGERRTHFALARFVVGWSDYFILDELLPSVPVETFVSPVRREYLLPFVLLPTFTETSIVNLAVASGLLSHALEVKQTDLPSAPATGRSTFDFQVRPHPDLGVVWTHSKGQVEIDAMLTARRRGRDTLFVVEAKTGSSIDSLAKHKLAYPILAIRHRVPASMPILPVYLRAAVGSNGVYFLIAECKPILSSDTLAISAIEVVKCQRLLLEAAFRQ